MTEQGARGNTSKQMQAVLGLPNNSTATNSGFESVIGSLNAQKGITLSIADSIWIEKIFTINPGFSSILSKYYGASTYPADFLNDASGETTEINNWVSNKTDEKITDMIPTGALNKNTTLVLADAVYFKGTWQIQFNKANTTNETFHAPSQQVQVPMMHLTTGALYYGNSNLQVLELNYSHSNLSMLILLPAQGYSLSQMQSNLSASELSDITSGLRSNLVAISLPRYNMTEAEELNDILESLGMTSAFNSTSANFSGMGNYSAYPNAVLYITHVLHKAFIQVNEQGTQAAAATAVVVGCSDCAAVEVPPTITFNADHPFMFFIIDKQSGAILFMGRLSNPNN
jgi:serpin B